MTTALTTSAPRPAIRRAIRQTAAVALGSLVIAASAQAAVPLWPVPMTLQTLAVLLVGAALGARLGFAAALLYLAQGAAGLPVFANLSAGAPVLAGRTAGYLFAFPIAALIAGFAADRGLCRRATTALAPMTTGTLVILALGALWLARFGFDPIAVGVAPYVPGAILKIAIAAALAPRALEMVQHFTR